jgi:hypothetical protein
MSTTAITTHLVCREHIGGPAAWHAARDLAALRNGRYFFRAWWLEVVTECVDAAPAITDPPDAVLDRLATRFEVRLSDAHLPRCPRCRGVLRWRDVNVPRPTSHCRPCSRPPGRRPAQPRTPRTLTDRFELFDPTDLTEVA